VNFLITVVGFPACDVCDYHEGIGFLSGGYCQEYVMVSEITGQFVTGTIWINDVRFEFNVVVNKFHLRTLESQQKLRSKKLKIFLVIPYDTNMPKMHKKYRCIHSYINFTAGQRFRPGNLDLV
jgi:hypothetical protein